MCPSAEPHPSAAREDDQRLVERQHPLGKCSRRGEFYRDYTRVIHCRAFRRLRHKTQVFVSPKNDHMCSRLEHAIHVSSISVTIARALGLNQDLAMAIAAAHDLGHAPFGHRGERAINSAVEALGKPAVDFHHETHGLRVVDRLETRYPDHVGMNLTFAVRDGIRLTREEFESGAIPRGLPRFMANHRLDHALVDIIIDLGPVDDMIVDGVSALASAFLAIVPDQARWRTMTMSACAFPQSMGVVRRDSHARVDRGEWKVWLHDLYANRSNMVRLPTYSDCGIQHTKGVEGFDPVTMQASAAVRYTLAEDWLLIKGEGTRSTPPTQQFPDLAARLTHGPLHRAFMGAAHCPGCAMIVAAAGGASGLGSPGAWRRLGTIHHITTVAKALAALPWP